MQKAIEEIFGGQPNLLALFREYERELVRAELGIHKQGATVERVTARNEALMQVAQSISANELKLLYYLRNTDGVTVESILKAMKRVYRAQCAFQNEINGESVCEDVLQVIQKKEV